MNPEHLDLVTTSENIRREANHCKSNGDAGIPGKLTMSKAQSVLADIERVAQREHTKYNDAQENKFVQIFLLEHGVLYFAAPKGER